MPSCSTLPYVRVVQDISLAWLLVLNTIRGPNRANPTTYSLAQERVQRIRLEVSQLVPQRSPTYQGLTGLA